jgi:hypothetical protein
MYEDNRVAFLGEESWKFARNALSLVLSNLAHFYPDIDLSIGFKKLPAGNCRLSGC